MSNGRRTISVIGTATANQEEYQVAEQVGGLLAKHEAVVICGGRTGVMEAVCKGAKQAGGITIGILPGHDSKSGNPYLTVSIPTGLGEARNLLVVRAGDSVIAIGGGYGTLSEIAFAKKLGQKVIGLKTWEATDSTGEPLQITRASSAEEAVSLALE
jgi:uncharacterized protein (TIGR00725 family)